MQKIEKLNYLGVEINWLFFLFILSVLQWIVIGALVYKDREKLFHQIVGYENIKEKKHISQ